MKDQAPHYLLAFDAYLMIGEDRHQEARNRFRECLTVLPEDMDSEATYVSLCCKLWLSMYNENCNYFELEQLRESASHLDVRGSPKYFLRIPSKSQLLKEFGNRQPLDFPGKGKSTPIKANRVYYGAGFNVR